ncbi:hypothetical protein ACFSBZ_06765 [Amnibacterium flavum]|uniref:Uncharacterized protein n=1 Tax=Amnibacterium flavum TaxID=2173173 RepID=A0A2V1HUU4_9MICO|nr:hypothetical protein [Amnibacterium flavum]PVZ93854.1 hypothetical protein DDQ50_08715 [Amnibacterium flavum]
MTAEPDAPIVRPAEMGGENVVHLRAEGFGADEQSDPIPMLAIENLPEATQRIARRSARSAGF